tara:strand:- start:543 stop:872 length:330 start_codon:yes stop_codon:yes gene_type:complete
MEWIEDERVWNALDELMSHSWPYLKEFLDVMHEYRHEFNLTGNAVLFGVLGKMCLRYNELRHQKANPAPVCLQEALIAAQTDRRVQRLFSGFMEQGVDERVQQFREENA